MWNEGFDSNNEVQSLLAGDMVDYHPLYGERDAVVTDRRE